MQLSDRTLGISLPHTWVKKKNIKKGHELDIFEHDDKLVITQLEAEKEKSHHVDISSLSADACVSLISVLHKSGYDDIALINGSKSVVEKVLERISFLINFEVLEHSQKKLWIKCISREIFNDFDNLLRRTFTLTSYFSAAVLECVKKNPVGLKKLVELENINNKLTNYCHRLMNKKQLTPKDHYVYTIIWLLEKIGDTLKDICQTKNPKISPSELKYLSEFNSLFGRLISTYYSNDLKKLSDLRSEIKFRLENFPKNNPSSLNIYVYTLHNYLNLMLGSTCGVMC